MAIGFGYGEETIIETYFGGYGMRDRDPVEGTFYLASTCLSATTTAAVGVVGAVYLGDIAFTILYYAFCLDDIGIL